MPTVIAAMIENETETSPKYVVVSKRKITLDFDNIFTHVSASCFLFFRIGRVNHT